MPLWRCPHCRTPQVESSRCWVCRRSTTSCAACRHFRRGIAGGLGLCGLDMRRVALRGTEMHGCWDAPEHEDAEAAGLALDTEEATTSGSNRRTFVPVEVAGRVGQAGAGVAAATRPEPARPRRATVGRARRIPGGWTLWGDLEG